MKITVVFVRVVTKPEYAHGEQRLLESYLKYPPEIKHELVIIDRQGDSPDDVPGAKHLRYDGGGWDCGAWQFAGKNIDTELLVCFNSSCYITGWLWLDRFVSAVENHGDGLYGPLTSNEISPHVRTPCMIFQPNVILEYPAEVKTREDTYRFESMGFGPVPNFTQWTAQRGFAVRLVTWYGDYGMDTWRDPSNIFRKGNQHALIVRDRHCDAYEASDEAGKAMLEDLAGRGDPVKQAESERLNLVPYWERK